MRVLAAVHTAFGAALLGVAAWWAVALLQILPHMKTGSPVANLAIVSMMALSQSGPLAAAGAWMLALGGGIRRRDPAVRTRLLRTHGMLFALGLAGIAIGVLQLEAAAESAARGGGLLGGFGVIPLGFGAAFAIFSALVLVTTYYALPPARST